MPAGASLSKDTVMPAIMKDVPIKARRKVPNRREYEEYPTRQWALLSKHIGKHLASGGAVEMDHRRLDPPLQGVRVTTHGAKYRAPYDIVEVVDVRFL
jgi:hypothetical protein